MKVSEIKPGSVFGKLIVEREVEPKIYNDGSKARQFLCKCKCGNDKIVVGRYLVRGETSTCGSCPTTYITQSVHYSRASHILDRCNNPNCDNYIHYGGRGIKCELGLTAGEVAESLSKVPGYFEGAQIDRIDNNGNYTLFHTEHGYGIWNYYDEKLDKYFPAMGNLRWVAPHVNSMNTRRVLTETEIFSKSFTSKDFKRICYARNWDYSQFTRTKNTNTRNEWFYQNRNTSTTILIKEVKP